MKIEVLEVFPTDKNLEIFCLIQNSVANPKTFRMGYVTKERAIKRFESATVLFIKCNGNNVGTFEYEVIPDNTIYFKSIAVCPEFQNRGIGKEVILIMLDRLKNFNKISLNTHPQNPALELYKSLGFIVVKKIRRNVIKRYEPSLLLSLRK